MNDRHVHARSVDVQIVNAFVSGEGGGNPAGVVLDADGLSEADMLAVASRVGLSETAFVSRSAIAGFKLDFFTPNRRIAHCGHATIAAFSHLAALGRIGDGETSKETVDGLRRVVVRDGAAYMEQLAPSYHAPADWAGVAAADVLAALGLQPGDVAVGAGPMRVDTGNGFVLLGVRDDRTLRAIGPDLDALSAISERLDLVGVYVFTRDPAATAMDAAARMFAPRFAIAEESATGMAAGPLACLLHDRLGVAKSVLMIDQGRHMTPPSPSVIRVELARQGGRIAGLLAGGRGALARSLRIDL